MATPPILQLQLKPTSPNCSASRGLMGHRTIRLWAAAFLLANAFSWFPPTLAAQVIRQAGTLTMTNGLIEFSKPPHANWQAATQGMPLVIFDRLRLSTNSRASIKLADSSDLSVGGPALLEFLPPPPQKQASVSFLQGFFRLFTRSDPGANTYGTPVVTLGSRGTEFYVEVEPGGRTEVRLFEGGLDLANGFGTLTLENTGEAIVEPGQPPRAVIETVNVVQWWLYYPAVLNPDELNLDPAEQAPLADSLEACRQGDLLAALRLYPPGHPPLTDDSRAYRAGLLLVVGQVAKAEALLADLPESVPSARALRTLIAAINLRDAAPADSPDATAGGELAQSYFEQSRTGRADNLELARERARRAVEQAPRFGFALARLAELEFSFGNLTAARRLLERALEASPRNPQALALNGFLLSSQNKLAAAEAAFEQAIAIDGSLGHAWLGRGLVRIRRSALIGDRRNDLERGLSDLQTAASLEPNRSLLRSYLGKGFTLLNDPVRARKELDLAREFDPNDPTPWLYSALLNRQVNRGNQAIADLEQSLRMNENRRVYRSQLLLDQDQAVRSANLADIYLEAGMTDLSVREAGRAVNNDYANYSAHLFLANSYNRERDPRRINLRFETAAVSEYLLANLLAPVEAGTFSPTPNSFGIAAPAISQQEYSKLFERRRLGLISSTDYLSNGDWILYGAQYGILGETSYSLEAGYRTENGSRPNNDLEDRTFSQVIRQRLTAKDTLYLQALEFEREGGNLLQYYDPAEAALSPIRFKETQEPTLLAGYHREWSPQLHTLVLAGRIAADLQVNNPNHNPILLQYGVPGLIEFFPGDPPLPPPDAGRLVFADQRASGNQTYQNSLELYSAEIQQLLQQPRHTTILGGRFQYGEFDTRNQETLSSVTSPFIRPEIVAEFDRLLADASHETKIQRWSVYGYHHWEPADQLRLIGGIAYDQLSSPDNFRFAPISSGSETSTRVSPKAGLIAKLTPDTTFRAAYTRSLGGVDLDQSFRLEPTQVAGFNQAFRSLAPESEVASGSGARYETYGISLEHRFPHGTYFGVGGQLLRSKESRTLGVLSADYSGTFDFDPAAASLSDTRQAIDFRERSLLVTLNQLIGDTLSIGVRYKLSEADLDGTFPGLLPAPPTVTASAIELTGLHHSGTLHEVNLYAIHSLPNGFFSQFEALWYSQGNAGYTTARPGDEFWQFNLFAGYRFANRRAELRAGLLNLTGEDYRLNPINLYNEPARDRMLIASLRISL